MGLMNLLNKLSEKGKDFLFLNPTMHFIGNKELYIENCKRIEEYNEVFIRLKASGMYIQIWGSQLKAFDFKTNGLIIRGKIEQIEMQEIK